MLGRNRAELNKLSVRVADDHVAGLIADTESWIEPVRPPTC